MFFFHKKETEFVSTAVLLACVAIEKQSWDLEKLTSF